VRRGERLAGKIISAGPHGNNEASGAHPIPEQLGKQYGLILTTTYRQIRERVAKPSVAAQAKTAVEITQKLRATMAMAWVPIPRITAERSTARSAIATKTFTGTSYNNPTGHNG